MAFWGPWSDGRNGGALGLDESPHEVLRWLERGREWPARHFPDCFWRVDGKEGRRLLETRVAADAADGSLERYINRFFRNFGAADTNGIIEGGSHDYDSENNRGVFGVMYKLPINIDSTVRVEPTPVVACGWPPMPIRRRVDAASGGAAPHKRNELLAC